MRQLLITTLCSMALIGCSTLLIDVDVYNGPLNNQEPERLEQVAAMVVAAKPLLEYLPYSVICADKDEAAEKESACSELSKFMKSHSGQRTETGNESNNGASTGGLEDLNAQEQFIAKLTRDIIKVYDGSAVEYSYIKTAQDQLNRESMRLQALLRDYRPHPQSDYRRLENTGYLDAESPIFINKLLVKEESPNGLRQKQKELLLSIFLFLAPYEIEPLLPSAPSEAAVKNTELSSLSTLEVVESESFKNFITRNKERIDQFDNEATKQGTRVVKKAPYRAPLAILNAARELAGREDNLHYLTSNIDLNAQFTLLTEDENLDEIIGLLPRALKPEYKLSIKNKLKQLAETFLLARTQTNALIAAASRLVVRVDENSVNLKASGNDIKPLFEQVGKLFNVAVSEKRVKELSVKQLPKNTVLDKSSYVARAKLYLALIADAANRARNPLDSITWQTGIARSPGGALESTGDTPETNLLDFSALNQNFENLAEVFVREGFNADSRLGLEKAIMRYRHSHSLGCFEDNADRLHSSCLDAQSDKREFIAELKSFSQKILFLGNNLLLVTTNGDGRNSVSRGARKGNFANTQYKQNSEYEKRIQRFISVLQAIGNTTRVMVEDIEREKLFRAQKAKPQILRNALDNTREHIVQRKRSEVALDVWLNKLLSTLTSARVKESETKLAIALDKCETNEDEKPEDKKEPKDSGQSKTQCLDKAKNEHAQRVSTDSDKEKLVHKFHRALYTTCQMTTSDDLRLQTLEQLDCVRGLLTSSEAPIGNQIILEYSNAVAAADHAINLPNFKEWKGPKLSGKKEIEHVWDSILSHLAIERVMADRNGASQQELDNINRALESARYFRSENSFIRATSDAIRMTLRPTDLLDEEDVSNHRNILNEFFIGDRTSSNSRVLQKFDNQNWHNVNRVAVKGGGDVNYVVVKDDIGNWYIKQYSEDKKEIMEGIKGIALFNTRSKNALRHAPFTETVLNEKGGQSRTEKIYRSFLREKSEAVRNQRVQQVVFIQGLKKREEADDKISFKANHDMIDLHVGEQQNQSKQEVKEAVHQQQRHDIIQAMIQGNELLASLINSLDNCNVDNAKKEDCNSVKAALKEQIDSAMTKIEVHLSNVESYVLSFNAAVE